jgi:hypothetical protein
MMRRTRWVALGLLLLGLSACGGCDEELQRDNNGPGVEDAGDVGDLDVEPDPDGSGPSPDVGGSDTGADDTGGEDGSLPDGGDDDGGFSEDGGDTGEPVETLVCPNRYQEVCDGECINVKVDPDNCGSCGEVCGEGEVCSSGVCSDTCLPSQEICGRTCVTLGSDNNHCGACDNACPDGQGCNNGVCVPAAVFEAPAQCVNGGPPIFLGDEEAEVDLCAGEVAEEKFRWAMCSCSSVNLTVGGLFTDAFDSLQGPYIPGVLGGSVGTNGSFQCSATVDVGGSLWVGGRNDLDFRSQSTVRMDMMAGRNVAAGGSLGLDVLQNASIGGSINPGGGGIRITDTLTVPQGTNLTGVTYGNLVRAPVEVPPPCLCGPDEIVPIMAIIEDHRTNNDNALIGLDPDLLAGGSEVRRVDLPCGKYFLNAINVNGDTTIIAHGRTALFIGGDVQAARITIQAAPDAELDVFIGGRVQAGGLTFGSQDFPAATRLYLGANDKMVITQDVRIGGFVYAYPGELHVTQNVDVYGGLFANQMTITSRLTIHYDRQILRAGETCRDPDPDPMPDPDPDPGQDAGMPDTNPGPDAGPGPDPGDQCVALDGRCSVDGDCCAPLVCDQGKCSTTRCKGTNDSCVYDSDCCSGICARISGSTQGLCIVN